MKKTLLVFGFLAALLLPTIAVAQTADTMSVAEKAQAEKDKATVEKWGQATLILKDENGKIIMDKTEKYPILANKSVRAAAEFNNCWDFCRRVCDGYGVCWLSCGTHCSPWFK